MISISKQPLYKLFFFLSKKRKNQLYFLFFLLIINGILESFTIASIIPFISIIAMKNEVIKVPFFAKLLNLIGINDLSQSLLLITILFCIFISLSTILRLFNLRYINYFSANLDIDISRLIFKNNIYQPYISYINKNSYDVITVINDKVSSTASALCSILNLLSSLILGIFIMISLFLINWRIVFLGSILLLFIYLSIYKRVKKRVSKNGQLLATLYPKRLRQLQEVFFGFRDVVVNNTEINYINSFNNYDAEIKLRKANTAYIAIFPRYFIEGLVLVSLVITVYNLSLLKINLLSLIPVFVSVVYAFQRLLPLIQQIYSTWANYRSKYPSICDVIEELEMNNFNLKNIKNDNKLKFNNYILFKNIDFSYTKSNLVLKDISFRINKGDHIGIYGQTGSGKSTFIDIVLGLLPPNKGEVFVDGRKIRKINNDKSWTSNFSHVSQNIYLKEGTIAENIAFGECYEEINFELLLKVTKLAHIYDFINNSEKGFKTNVGERGCRLSGGQRQRVAIARALYKCKDILVLDEATSALDHRTEENIINSIKNNTNLTILMVTHRLKSLRICNRIIKVQNKSIIEEKENI